MLILLPPSEGKSDPGPGPPTDFDELVFAGHLRAQRERLIAGLEALSGRPTKKAVEALGISTGQAADILRDGQLAKAPAAAAAEVYSGVLYDHLDFGSLTTRAAARAAGNVLISSALWGMLRPGDRIPYYRFSMKARLPRLPGMAAFWRPALTEAMEASGHDEEGGLILDMRSAAYSAAWKPKRARLVSVRAFTESDGSRKAVSHMAKATRGDVARMVLGAGKVPADAGAVAALLEAKGLRVELSDGFLDVIEMV
ncbi:MAG: peroxide stress protein YaaA [Solirubrobacterales bacterium]